MNKNLGTAEKEVLARLQDSGGSWDSTRPALWETRHWTETLLLSLVKKGYASESVPGKFEITTDGSVVAAGVPRPERRSRPGMQAPLRRPGVHSRNGSLRYLGRVLG